MCGGKAYRELTPNSGFKTLEFRRERDPFKKRFIVLEMQDLVEKAKLFDYSLTDRKLYKWENGIYKEIKSRKD